MNSGSFPSSPRSAMAIVVAVAVVTALVGCSSDGSTATVDDAPSPVTEVVDPSTPTSSPDAGREPEGFSTVQALITDADGDVCEVCLWLADDATERGRGLMGVTDLGDAVGMAFVFEQPTRGSFYMFQTPTPLSIAWFGPDGGQVGSADMAPCLDTPAGDCPLYSPDGEYDLAIEVFEGGLEPLGLGPGSSVELIAGSEAARCPLDS